MEMTEREELSCYISDCYKDLNGFRPRHIDYTNTPIEELRAIYHGIVEELEREIGLETEYSADSLAQFQRELLEYQENFGARTEIDAILWMMDGDGFSVDTGWQSWRWDIEQWFKGRGLSDCEAEGYAKEFIAAKAYRKLGH